MALWSFLCCIIHLSDRHLNNLMICLNDGHIANIDFDRVFYFALDLGVPELVQFRLTNVF